MTDDAANPFRKLTRDHCESDDSLQERINALAAVAAHVPDDIDIDVRWDGFDMVVRLTLGNIWVEFTRNLFEIMASGKDVRGLDVGEKEKVKAALEILDQLRPATFSVTEDPKP